MYLKSIEIQGFKSFANKTVFQFHNGITGIVGPNGSGKSNVADAVRWVLGEQRVKQLRGGSMQDVIFAGTQTRKPLGFASVSITLSNEDRALAIDYDEVTVTRRLYRSGESEYLLNGTACRLKDINELFYDTGIGKEGYSIIGQGQIDRILSGKPEDRRELFDEAAGIVKFKRRKTEASRKLDNEQASLTRVNDILSELERQVGPLKRQSEKAREYLRLREELKAYDVNLFLAEYEENRESLARYQEAKDTSSAELDQVREKSDRVREEYEAAQTRSDQLSGDQEAAMAEREKTRLLTQQMNGQIDLLNEQIRSGETSMARQKDRLAQAEAGEKEARTSAASADEALGALQKELDETLRSGAALEEEYREEQEHLTGLNETLEQRQKELMEVLAGRADLRAEEQRLATLSEQVKIRKSQLGGEILKLRSEMTGQDRQLAAIETQTAAINEKIEALNADSEACDEKLRNCQDELTAGNIKLEELQKQYHQNASRLEALRGIAERYDGYGNSIRRVMEQRKREKGILGVVADIIRTKPEYETAIETALGGSIQNIVTEDEETAKRMISFLKQNKYGRATFLPLTAVKYAQPWKQNDALAYPGVIGLADSLVQADAKYSSLVKYLLGRTIVTDNIDHAVELARAFRYSLRIVTLEGESLSPGGSMTGGAFKNSSNLLSRRREIEDLTGKVRDNKQELDDLRLRIDNTRAERNRLRDEIREISGKLQEQYLKQNTLVTQKREIENRKNTAAAEEGRYNDESVQIRTQIMSITRESMELKGKLQASEEAEKRAGAAIEEVSDLIDRSRDKEAELAEKLEKLHLDQTALQERLGFQTREKERLEEELGRLLREQETLRASLKDESLGTEEKQEKIEELRRSIARAEKEQEAQEENLQSLAGQREEVSARMKQLFEEREELSERASLLDRECMRLSAQIEKLEEQSESRSAYMWEEYELTYSAALTLRRDDLGSRTNWRRQMAELRRGIRDLGSVNVNAIEEYKEVSERYEYLNGQRQDILEAEEALRKIIADLDSEMRKQFREQFALIAAEFNKTFRELFGGGTGTLELMDDEDILECGIIINAQPPGKKLQNMLQMSGGEKALTAIALLFAIQNLKPSPFCLLDEIEAALDESNVDRYARYLHKLTRHTQFIIITHRRGTMAAADRLYGVTMQEKGISALVSVNLIENELDA